MIFLGNTLSMRRSGKSCNYASYYDIVSGCSRGAQKKLRLETHCVESCQLTEVAMLPLAWFCIVAVVFLYSFWFFVELRARARSHVKGCPTLPYICSKRLDSLIVIEPDLSIVEVASSTDGGKKPGLPDARRIPIAQLDGFLDEVSPRSVFVFYDSAAEPADWSRVESIVNRHKIATALVLKGGLEMWLSEHRSDQFAVA
jgi:hypothetical protein